MLKSEKTDNSLDGYFVSGAFEQINYDGDMAGGFRIGYLSTNEESEKADVSMLYYSMPFTLFGKYYFGPAKFRGYVLGEFGIQFSRFEYTGSTLRLSDNDAGFLGGLGLGGQFYLNEKTFFNLAYTFNLWGNSYYQDGFLHQIKLGIGFQYE